MYAQEGHENSPRVQPARIAAPARSSMMLAKTLVLVAVVFVVSWSSMTRGDVPNPDVRVAVDFYPIQQAVRGFQYYKLGQWIQFGEFKCGDRNLFWLIVREPPFLG